MNYQQQTIAVMNGVERVVALYDGTIRFLHKAIASIEAGDVAARRDAVRRALEILVYLQARLRPDVGGQSAVALSEFYAAIYAQCVRASRDASIPLFEDAIRDVRNVRDAWQQISGSEAATTATSQTTQTTQAGKTPPAIRSVAQPGTNAACLLPNQVESKSRRWSA